MGLTYEGSTISAMLDDVWSDVGNVIGGGLSTLVLGNSGCFHTGGRPKVESFERVSEPVYT